MLAALFTQQQIKLYGFALRHKFSEGQLLEMMMMLQKPVFGVEGLDTDCIPNSSNLLR